MMREKRTASRRINFIPCQKLYLSDENLDIEGIFHRIRMGKKCRSFYLIARSEREGELFVIYSAQELLLPIYDGRDIYVAGIAKGYRRTLGLLIEMLLVMYQDTKTFDVDHYFHP